MLSNVGPRFRIGVIVVTAQGAHRGRGADTNPRKIGLENFINPTYPGLETVNELNKLGDDKQCEPTNPGHNSEGELNHLGDDKDVNPTSASSIGH